MLGIAQHLLDQFAIYKRLHSVLDVQLGGIETMLESLKVPFIPSEILSNSTYSSPVGLRFLHTERCHLNALVDHVGSLADLLVYCSPVCVRH